MKNDLVECRHCGWVHYTVTRDFAVKEVKRFLEYYNTLTEEKRFLYYNNQPATLSSYETCDRCGKPADMMKTEKTMNGHTIGPIIWEHPDERNARLNQTHDAIYDPNED